MSNISDLDLNLETLFQPAWAQGKSEANRFEKFTGDEGARLDRRSGDRGDRRGPRRADKDRPPRAGGKFGERKGGFRGNDRRGDRAGQERRETQEPATPPPEFQVAFIPEEKGVEQLARQIRMTGRAYPLFQIAQLILQKADRYSVQITPRKKADGTAEKLYVCVLDETPWTSEDDAVAHALKHHFATFYQPERTQTEPPKGVYTFVAQCGMSGVILGPPNHHDYQNQLRKLHTEKFSQMPFDAFKSRVRIVKDEAVVKKWIEEQSFKTEYNALNVPDPLKLPTMEAVEKHFRDTHKDNIIKPVETASVAGAPSRSLRCGPLQRLIRQEWEHQRYFPLPVAMKLSQQFARHGLQFFKVNKTYTHVSVARPQFLDTESSPVSDGIKRIVEFINANPKCTRKKLIETLAPAPQAAVIPVSETPVSAPPPAQDGAAAQTPAESKPAETESSEPTPEQTAVMVDLHWLIHQGAVLEFADGRMETAKRPAPNPPKTGRKSDEKPAGEPAVAGPETVAPAETAASTEAAPAPNVSMPVGVVPGTLPETPTASENPQTT